MSVLNSNLNSQQKLAVETVEGPILILAGAGTGKTKTLVSRIAYLIQSEHAYPDQIMAVTFTNKAANEMMIRIRSMVGESQFSWIGTFHSIAAKILRIHAEEIKLKSDFVILDSEDQFKMFKRLLEELNIMHDKNLVYKYINIISSWKDKALTPGKVSYNNLAKDFTSVQALKIYEKYQKRLLESNSADFGDLLLHNITIFNKNSEILEYYRGRFKFLMVDEYQDTNVCQYLWLRLLAQNHRNICCVGDDDQSIYGWRGAEIGNILRFSEDFEGATVIRLEQNYRSTNKILEAAHNIIKNNSSRLGKKLWTADNKGEEVRILNLWDGSEEARTIVSIIRRNLDRFRYKDTAILVRAGFQTRAFEEECIEKKVPYRIVGGLKFYERKEVKDITSYLRLIVNPQDNLAFERIINSPKRGIGPGTIDKIYNTSMEMGCSMLDATIALFEAGELKSKNISTFIEKIKKWKFESDKVKLQDLLKSIATESGYIEMLKKAGEESRVENVAEIFRVTAQFSNAVEFLEHISLVTDNDADTNNDSVNIMTLHSSKGLEFEQVFLPGWEEGLFPHSRTLGNEQEIEEERRLAYVGITRAKTSLTISSAKRRFTRSGWQSTFESRFLSELRGKKEDQKIRIYSQY